MTNHNETKEALEAAMNNVLTYRDTRIGTAAYTSGPIVTEGNNITPSTIRTTFAISDACKKAMDAMLDGSTPPEHKNQAPVARFTVEMDGLVATFHNKSSDPDGDMMGYAMDFGDGSEIGEQVEAIEHTYTPGAYTPTLTVTDPSGAASTYSLHIVAKESNAAPPPPPPPNGNKTHTVNVGVTDGAGRRYTASATRGNDPTAAKEYKPLVGEDGKPHRVLTATFYDDRVYVGAIRADAKYSELNCQLEVTYDDEPAAVPPSSYADGHVNFYRGCMNPPIRYGKQMSYDEALIDWDLIPTYAREPQTPFDDSGFDYTFNGRGATHLTGMATTGERGEIGFFQQIAMAFLTNPTEETWAVLQRADDWAGVWPIYFCDPDTGDIIDKNTYPDANLLPVAQRASVWDNPIAEYVGSCDGDTLTKAGVWPLSASPMVPNGAHLTSYCMLTPMVCPTAADRDQCAFWGNYPLLEINPAYNRTGGVMLGPQRRAAWCLRSLYMAELYSSKPDYFAAEVERNIEIANKIERNDSGLMLTRTAYRGTGSAKGCKGMSMWMQGYMLETCDAVCKKHPSMKPFAQFIGSFYAQWGKTAYAPLTTIYSWICVDSDGNLIPDKMQQLRNSLVTNGWSDADAQAITAPDVTSEDVHAMIADHYKRWDGKCVNGICDYRGSIHAADSYPANAIMATTAAYNVGTPDCDAALHRVLNLPTKPDYSDNQKYHLVPSESVS